MLDHTEPVDDFSDTPTLEVGAGMTVVPSEDQVKANKMRLILEQASSKALSLGKGRQITTMANQGVPATVIAEKTGLTPAEVKQTNTAFGDLVPEDQRELKKYDIPRRSVFDLYARLEEHMTDLEDTMKFMDDPELKLGYFGQKLQLFKLSKDVMQDVAFKKKEEAEREEEIQLILGFLERLDPGMANELFKAIKELRERRKILGGK